jgi:hypothetical protein
MDMYWLIGLKQPVVRMPTLEPCRFMHTGQPVRDATKTLLGFSPIFLSQIWLREQKKPQEAVVDNDNLEIMENPFLP